MSVISAAQSSLLGIQRGLDGVQKNAAEIASKDQLSAQSPKALAESFVELKLNSLQVGASAKALSIVMETIGTIIDIKV